MRGLFVAEPGGASATELVGAVTGLPAISGDGRWLAYGTGAGGMPQSILLSGHQHGADGRTDEWRARLARGGR